MVGDFCERVIVIDSLDNDTYFPQSKKSIQKYRRIHHLNLRNSKLYIYKIVQNVTNTHTHIYGTI